jgi:hypothetical protein
VSLRQLRNRQLAPVVVIATLAGACGPTAIDLVGDPGGVYRPGEGCTLAPAAPACPGPSDPQPKLRFEAETDTGITTDTSDAAPGALGNLRVTCARSYCGTGSLEADASLVWVNNDNTDPKRMGSFAHTFDQPVDLMGRTIGFYVYVEARTGPMHAQIGVIFDYWRYIGWTPLAEGWNRVEGVVSPANPLTKIDAAVTSIPVTEIRMDVYVPVAAASGTEGSWSGKIFLDDVSW